MGGEAAVQELKGVVRVVGKDPEAIEGRDGREVLGVPGVSWLGFPMIRGNGGAAEVDAPGALEAAETDTASLESRLVHGDGLKGQELQQCVVRERPRP